LVSTDEIGGNVIVWFVILQTADLEAAHLSTQPLLFHTAASAQRKIRDGGFEVITEDISKGSHGILHSGKQQPCYVVERVIIRERGRE
jgi:hypothetical protein